MKIQKLHVWKIVRNTVDPYYAVQRAAKKFRFVSDDLRFGPSEAKLIKLGAAAQEHGWSVFSIEVGGERLWVAVPSRREFLEELKRVAVKMAA
jgi:hypothetical protein